MRPVPGLGTGLDLELLGFGAVISADAVAEYRDAGFIVVEDIFGRREVQRMRDALDELVAAARGVTAHTDILDLEPGHTPENPRVRRIKNAAASHPVFDEMSRHPNLIAALTALLGPNLRMHGSKLNLKSADFGSPVEWHQDWAFYPHSNDDVLAVGVMLDDMTPENGPLMIVPGSHTGPTYDHHQDGRFVGGIDINAAGLDVTPAEMVTGRAGACSFHHARAVHGSARNASDRDRRLLLYQVAAGDAWDLRGMPTEDSWDAYAASFIAGEPTIEPRIAPAPVRLPYPGPLKGGSIYESQTVMASKTFAAAEDALEGQRKS